MSDEQQQLEVVFNPGRKEVYDLVALAVNSSEGNAGQTFSDILVATIIIGILADVDMTDVQDLFNRNMEHCTIAAGLLAKSMEERTDVG